MFLKFLVSLLTTAKIEQLTANIVAIQCFLDEVNTILLVVMKTGNVSARGDGSVDKVFIRARRVRMPTSTQMLSHGMPIIPALENRNFQRIP